MEIPIQVAVRIYPCIGDNIHLANFDANGNVGPTTTTTTTNSVAGAATDSDESAAVDSNNGRNVNEGLTNDNAIGVTVEEKEKHRDDLNPSLGVITTSKHSDATEKAAGLRCCVQAIPIAAAMMPCALLGAPPEHGGSIAAGLVQVGVHSFPVTHALRTDCTQSHVYHQTVFPLISLFLEGFDASVVTYGQRRTGKTYTLYGPGFECVYGETDQGVVQRCVRDIFTHMNNHPERTYAVNIGWVGICGESIRDLLGVGNVLCATVSEVFHWLQVGLTVLKAELPHPLAHTLFTLTLEQQWVSKQGLIQHRLSTASFSDLCGTQRLFGLDALRQPTSVPKDEGLQALEHVVHTLTDPALMYGVNGNIPYNRTTLTTLLKDSFGGRAQTLLLLCVSPLERDINETICNVQFAFKVQCVRNYVIINTFSDDNTPVSPPAKALPPTGGRLPGCPTPAPSSATTADQFGLQFAASQWFKLVSNAEGLFSKLVSSTAISELDKEQIEEWLFLKQECEECLSSSEVLLRSQKQLVPIQEADEEPEEPLSEPDTSCQHNSENDTDSESEQPEGSADLVDKLDALMEQFSHKTDKLVLGQHKEFMARQPKAVMDSQESVSGRRQEPIGVARIGQQEVEEGAVEKYDERKASIGGRRRSIQPGASLSSAEIAMLNRVATREQSTAAAPDHVTSPSGHCVIDDFLDSSNDKGPLRLHANSPLDCVQRKLRKLMADIEAREQQITEVEETMQLKRNIIADLVKNSETRTHAKQRFNKKQAKLEVEYEKAKKQLSRGIEQGHDAAEVERRCALLSHLEQRLKDVHSIKQIAGESVQKLKRLQQSLHESKKRLEELHKKAKKERKMREHLEGEERALREKDNRSAESRAIVKMGNATTVLAGGGGGGSRVNTEGKNLKEMQLRIAHLDHVLREKSDNLEHCKADDSRSHGVPVIGGAGADLGDPNGEALRHEIRNLRRTRDHLLEQRCSLDRKLKREKGLSQREERKLLECDEAIEAIDAAIEFKNELICGHKSIDTSERLQREKGEQMLMARLNKLSAEEMRTLLYKYFNKVIDLRDSSRKLEVQLMQLERERDSWEWKERVLSNAVRQARLEGERNTVLLQRQQEMKLALMVRHLAEETSAASSASYGEMPPYAQRLMRPPNNPLALAPAPTTSHQQQQELAQPPFTSPPSTATNSSQFSDSEFELDFYKSAAAATVGAPPAAAPHHGRLVKPAKHGEVEMCPLPDALSKYKPLDKFKEKERETKNKLFAKFQVLTRYAGGGGGGGTSHEQHHNGQSVGGVGVVAGGSISNSKKKDKHATLAVIPQENLKRLIAAPPATKVTRQKNKIIIQDATR